MRTLAGCIVLASLLIPVQAAPASAAEQCPNADIRTPTGSGSGAVITRARIAEAIGCLIALEHYIVTGGQGIGYDDRLRKAAAEHASQAAERKWWRGRDLKQHPEDNPHVNPVTGSTVADRIRAANYCAPRQIERVWEIAYTGVGAGSTARAAFNWWKYVSTGDHYSIIANPSKRHYGVGLAPGSANPNLPSDPNMVTVVVNFGTCAP